jgi:undecaprenyl-diphosphatase
MGGLVFGLDRRTAAEFSFLLAIPTMFAASGYDLYRNVGHLNGEDAALLIVGFCAALVSSILSVSWLVSFVSRHQFTPFGWYRIILGIGMATWLLTAG